jgi:hypothetical protein
VTRRHTVISVALAIYAVATIVALADKRWTQEPSPAQTATAEAAITNFIPVNLEDGSTVFVGGLAQWKRLYGRGALIRSGAFTDISVGDRLPSESIACRTHHVCDTDSRPLYSLYEVVRPTGGVVLVLSPVLGLTSTSNDPLILLNTTKIFGPANDTPNCNMNESGGGPTSDFTDADRPGWSTYSCLGPPTRISTFLHWLQRGCAGLEGWLLCVEPTA